MSSGEGIIGGFALLALVGGLLYVLPAIIAWRNDHKDKVAILALDLLLGWSLIGWVAALVWALKSND